MLSFGDFLDKFKHITLPDETVRRAVCEILAEKGITVDFKNVKIHHRVAYIEGDPILKSEMYLRKTEILSRLREQLGIQAPGDIR